MKDPVSRDHPEGADESSPSSADPKAGGGAREGAPQPLGASPSAAPAPSQAPADAGAAPAGSAAAEGPPAAAEPIDIDQFMKVQLRTAIVEFAERVPKADRLLRLVVDLGGEKRQIVAGIAATYAPEQLVGKTVVVVANLKPARLRGVESQGMLLAADSGGGPIVVGFEREVAPGTRVR